MIFTINPIYWSYWWSNKLAHHLMGNLLASQGMCICDFFLQVWALTDIITVCTWVITPASKVTNISLNEVFSASYKCEKGYNCIPSGVNMAIFYGKSTRHISHENRHYCLASPSHGKWRKTGKQWKTNNPQNVWVWWLLGKFLVIPTTWRKEHVNTGILRIIASWLFSSKRGGLSTGVLKKACPPRPCDVHIATFWRMPGGPDQLPPVTLKQGF